MTERVTQATGNVCPAPSDWKNCRPWDLTQQTRVNCYADSLIQESLNIAGAQINVLKLLGVHEQTKLVDLTGSGKPISSGSQSGFGAANAFNVFNTEWRSQQAGSTVTSTSYIGYDFGVVKIPTGRRRYGIDASIRQHVTALKIKQSANPLSRVTKARVERSENGLDWYGVSIVTLPNNDELNTIQFKHSVPSRYWRIRPITFVGTDCDVWGVQALQLYDYSVTHISNIQDKVLLENRDRDYQEDAITLRGYYDVPTRATDLTRFGVEDAPLTYVMKINFSSCVELLGRPVVIGDIIELPSEVQYTPNLEPVKRFLEVTDVTWDTTSYTPGWQPLMLAVSAEPVLASQETQKVFGDLAQKYVDNSGLYSIDDGNNKKYQDFSAISQAIEAEAKTQVPESGSEGSNTIREFTPEEVEKAAAQGVPNLNKIGLNRRALYMEDAIPQNGAPYTEGSDFPPKPNDGDYHRLVYVGSASDVPARLFRWSQVKGRWVFLEKDRRAEFNDTQPRLQEYTTSKYKKFASEIK